MPDTPLFPHPLVSIAFLVPPFFPISSFFFWPRVCGPPGVLAPPSFLKLAHSRQFPLHDFRFFSHDLPSPFCVSPGFASPKWCIFVRESESLLPSMMVGFDPSFHLSSVSSLCTKFICPPAAVGPRFFSSCCLPLGSSLSPFFIPLTSPPFGPPPDKFTEKRILVLQGRASGLKASLKALCALDSFHPF